jgi:hypothetical protein
MPCCIYRNRCECDSDLQLELDLPDHLEEALVAGPVVLLRPVGLDDSPPAVDHDPIHPCCLDDTQLARQLVDVDDFAVGTHHIELKDRDARPEKLIPHLSRAEKRELKAWHLLAA